MRTGIKNFLISFIKNNMRNSDHATTIFVLVLLLFVAFIYRLDHLLGVGAVRIFYLASF